MLPFLLTAREGPLWANRGTVRMNSAFKGVPLAHARGTPPHSCAPAAKPARPMTSKPAELLSFYSGANM